MPWGFKVEWFQNVTVHVCVKKALEVLGQQEVTGCLLCHQGPLGPGCHGGRVLLTPSGAQDGRVPTAESCTGEGWCL